METLLNAKRADLYLQLLALLAPFVWAIAAKDEVILLVTYFSVGGVQVISWLVNKYRLDDRLKSPQRARYEKWLFVVFLVFVLLLLPCLAGIEIAYIGMAIFAFLMLIIGAGMGCWYIAVTAGELEHVRRLARRSFK